MEELEFKGAQRPINQRLTFLLKSLNLSARNFSDAIGESPTNTQNYVGSRNAEPRASYLQNVLRHFTTINPSWLLTGEGEPFLSDAPAGINSSVANNRKISRSMVVGHVGGNSTQNQGASANEAAMQRELELLRSQLADKERTIQILLNQQSKP